MRWQIVGLTVAVAFLVGLAIAFNLDESDDQKEEVSVATETALTSSPTVIPTATLPAVLPTPIIIAVGELPDTGSGGYREVPITNGLCYAPDQTIEWVGEPVLQTENVCVIISAVQVDPAPVFVMINAFEADGKSAVEIYRDLKKQVEEAITQVSGTEPGKRIVDRCMFRIFWTPSRNVSELLGPEDLVMSGCK